MNTEPLAHDLFLLMLNLSQLRSQTRILAVFLEAMNSLQPQLRLQLLEDEQDASLSIEIATTKSKFGRISIESTEELANADLALIRNAVGMLAIILENRVQASLLADENLRLEAAVQARTAELEATNEALKEEIRERQRNAAALRKSNQHLKATLEKLQQTQEHMLQQERLAAVGQLAAGIAHEFNNILSSIVLYTQMALYNQQVPDATRKQLKTVVKEAQHATDLVQKVTDFGRQAIIECQPLAMVPFLHEVVALMQRTLPQNIALELMYEPEGAAGHGHIVNADAARIQQAIVNLALNVRDAMPNGGQLTISLVTLENQDIQCVNCGRVTGGTWVEVTISDTGIGIPPDVLPHIFEPFFTTRAPLGHGLGLAQVYGIVKQHKGHLNVETQLGEGTTFSLYWPALNVSPQK